MRKTTNILFSFTLVLFFGYVLARTGALREMFPENPSAAYLAGDGLVSPPWAKFAQNSHTPALSGDEYDGSEPGGDKRAETAARQRVVAQNLVGQMRDVHFNHPRYDTKMSAFSWTNYLESLDQGKIYFTHADIAEFEPHKYKMEELARTGDLSYAKTVFDRLHQRVRERVEYLETNYGTNAPPLALPEFAEDDVYRWRRKTVSWAAGDDEFG